MQTCSRCDCQLSQMYTLWLVSCGDFVGGDDDLVPVGRKCTALLIRSLHSRALAPAPCPGSRYDEALKVKVTGDPDPLLQPMSSTANDVVTRALRTRRVSCAFCSAPRYSSRVNNVNQQDLCVHSIRLSVRSLAAQFREAKVA